MIKWETFKHSDSEYDLSHLHPFSYEFAQPAQGKFPERRFKVDFCFSLHCFTHAPKEGDDKSLNYSDRNETRAFNFERYELSKSLPQLLITLDRTRIIPTDRNNFFIVEIPTLDGKHHQYEVYFDVKNSQQGNDAHILVQSAYSRDDMHSNSPKPHKKVSIFTIIEKRKNNKPVAVQHRA